jgi:hypothetical protein
MNRFPLGRMVATPGALSLLTANNIGPLQLLDRHVAGDWGELDKADQQANEDALLNEGRLLSRYMVGQEPVWVITEWDRSVTTILLPQEY